MKKILLILIIACGCTSNNDFKKGRQQLEQQGYVEVVNTGYNLFCCSENESYSTGFKCKDSQGNTVTGCFCSSPLKGVTIRFK
jgi:hypothetical protein